MDSMSAQAAQAARASRGPDWRLDERLSEGEIALPDNLPIRMWIFTMKHVTQGHMGILAQDLGYVFGHFLVAEK